MLCSHGQHQPPPGDGGGGRRDPPAASDCTRDGSGEHGHLSGPRGLTKWGDTGSREHHQGSRQKQAVGRGQDSGSRDQGTDRPGTGPSYRASPPPEGGKPCNSPLPPSDAQAQVGRSTSPGTKVHITNQQRDDAVDGNEQSCKSIDQPNVVQPNGSNAGNGPATTATTGLAGHCRNHVPEAAEAKRASSTSFPKRHDVRDKGILPQFLKGLHPSHFHPCLEAASGADGLRATADEDEDLEHRPECWEAKHKPRTKSDKLVSPEHTRPSYSHFHHTTLQWEGTRPRYVSIGILDTNIKQSP